MRNTHVLFMKATMITITSNKSMFGGNFSSLTAYNRTALIKYNYILNSFCYKIKYQQLSKNELWGLIHLVHSSWVLSSWVFPEILNFYYWPYLIKIEFFWKYSTWQYSSWVFGKILNLRWPGWYVLKKVSHNTQIYFLEVKSGF